MTYRISNSQLELARLLYFQMRKDQRRLTLRHTIAILISSSALAIGSMSRKLD